MVKAKKCCMSPECTNGSKNKLMKSAFVYCPLCGEQLTYVCKNKNCRAPLDAELVQAGHVLCADCQKISDSKKAGRQRIAAIVGNGALSALVITGGALGMLPRLPKSK